MRIELEARASLGGLRRSEYVLHGALNLLHGGSLALVLASRSASVWHGAYAAELDAVGLALKQLAPYTRHLLPGAVVVAVVHVALLHPRFRHEAAAQTAAGPNGAGPAFGDKSA